MEITENKNSEYANICVGLKDKQKTVFVNGQPTATIPYDNTRFNETFSHLALLEHDQPKHILLIGNYYGLIKEILKHNVEKIDYVELDPMLIDSFKKIAKEELQNKKVNIKINDPRAYMRNSIQNYDLIFINYLVSSSIQINRFYTQEFFSLLKNNLNKNSLLVLSCQGSESSYSPELKNINTHLLNTLIDSFRYIKVVPGLTNIILASDYKINLNADYLFDKLKRREIKTSFIDTGHLNLLLNKSREEWFWHSLKKNNTTKNLDLKPRLVLDNLLLWNTKSFPGLRSISLLIEKINFNAIFILLVIILSSGFITKRVRKGFTLEYIAISTAFSEMLLVLSLIIAMQVYFGVVYSKIILITTSFMAGLSFGTLHCYRNAERIKESPTIKLLEAGFILIAVAILIMFETKILINELSLYVIACSIGIIHGWEFPLINKIYLTIKPKSNISTIYAFELLGGFFAAAFTTTLLIPIIGIPKCIMLVIIIKIYSLLYLNRKKIN
ncbi:MAG: hypothetical protein P9L96_00745 [Candidatus Gygaella obscura]|nr:hypothetical protein [Candidatus Gygaella obscura]